MGKLGFGIAGPLGARLFPANMVQKLIEQAIAGGVRFFDTGPLYGGGEAERRLGKALAGHDRDSLFITSKAGVDEYGNRDFDPVRIRESLLRSLERLGLAHVDGLFLHGVAGPEMTEALFSELAALQQQGLFKHLGMAGRGDELDSAITSGKFDMLMLPMGPQSIKDNQTRAQKAQAMGTRIIGIEMLYHTRRPWRLSLQAGDLWHMARRLRRGGDAVSPIKPVTALQSALQNPLVDVVLTSSSKPAHVEEWLVCLDEAGNAS
ncbi:hypothetical protein MNBD_ALPHA06-1153 [hydrothermal vent metagenome]|uniref:NADP-dependent oxidoreductase domain-containing protein n=1 Tax=hydrothermal vent metagenome TaxID=652676 RepID=A0A3B0SAM6_9ZZZZ